MKFNFQHLESLSSISVMTGEQSELPRSISWNSVESDLGCTSMIYFDNVTLTLHNAEVTETMPIQ